MAEPHGRDLPPPRDRAVPDDELARVTEQFRSALDEARGRRARAPGRRRVAAAAAAALTCGAALVAALWLARGPGGSPSLGGESQLLVLSTEQEEATVEAAGDATIRLAPQTRLELESVTDERVVYRMEKGAATFAVAKDRSRQFAVRVRDAEVRVVGTRFRVHAGSGPDARLAVEVFEGVIELVTAAEVQRLAAGSSFEEPGPSAAVEPEASAERLRAEAPAPSRKEPPRKEPSRKEPSRKEPSRKEPPRKPPTRVAKAVETATSEAPSSKPSVAAKASAPPPAAEEPARGSGDPSPSPARLLELAADARADGDVEAAIGWYRALRQDHPEHSLVPIAAYAEGRLLADSRHAPELAVRAWEVALRAGPPPSIEQTLLARMVRAYSELRRTRRCRELREIYLERFPRGLRVDDVRAACDRPGP